MKCDLHKYASVIVTQMRFYSQVQCVPKRAKIAERQLVTTCVVLKLSFANVFKVEEVPLLFFTITHGLWVFARTCPSLQMLITIFYSVSFFMKNTLVG